MRIAILDDIEGAALGSADWSALGADEVTAFDEHVADRDELAGRLAAYDVIVLQRERTTVDRALLERLPALRLLVTTGPVNAAVDREACADHGITVCGTSVGSMDVVEHAWALVLAAFRHVPEHDRSMRAGEWRQVLGRRLEGATLGLLGLGRTGTRMARIGAAFGMDVVAWSENLTPEVAAERGARWVSREDLFASSDVVSVHLLLSKRTRGMVGDDDLRRMRRDAWLVNTSRGPIVDQDALVRACVEGRIGGVALDVYDEEPLPADSPVRSLGSTVLTPHTGYVTAENYRAWFGDVVEDIAAWRRGEPVRVLG